MKYLVLDCETGVHNVGENAVGKEKGHWRCPENKLVMWGCYDGHTYSNWSDTAPSFRVFGDYNILVGHNIKFDLHHLMKHYPEFEEWLWNPDNMIWDTMTIEYLITGQQAQMQSLDKLSEKYGGTQKEDKIKRYWDEGIMTEDIPRDELAEYLEHDVRNTHLIFTRQALKVRELGMEALVRTQMKAMVATLEMEHNGMAFDKDMAQQEATKLLKEIDEIALPIEEEFAKVHEMMPMSEVKAGSNQCLSRYLFGGGYDVKVDVPVMNDDGVPVLYKSGMRKGQIKTRKESRGYLVEGYFHPKSEWKTATGYFQVNDKVLQELLNTPAPDHVLELISTVLKYRALQKDYKTYFIGFSELAWPTKDGKHFIHGSLNHCVTNTGRLSSSKPNTQNLSGKER